MENKEKEIKQEVEEQEVKEKERNLNESIINIRVKLQNSKIKKSGKNKFAGFDYFELADFLPRLNELMLEEGINDNFKITNEIASLTLIKGEERQEYTMPYVMFETPLTFKKDKSGNYMKNQNGEFIQVPSMQDIQYLGALNTYYKRYLYLNAFGITDREIIDSMDNSNLEKNPIDELKDKIKKYGTKASAKLKELGKKLSELNEEELKILLDELEKGE